MGTYLYTAVFWLCSLCAVSGLPDIIRVGGLFDMDDTTQQIAFQNAVNRVNGNRNILPKARLMAQIDKVPNNSYHGAKKVCGLMDMGIAAIFGPGSAEMAAHVQSICDAMEVPHIETNWKFSLYRDAFSINLFPHHTSLSRAYVDFIRLWNFHNFTLLYEDSDGLIRLQDVLKMPTRRMLGQPPMKVTVRQLPEGDDYRAVLREIKMMGATNIVLDCNSDSLYSVLKQAQQVGLMNDQYSYFITSLDLHTIDLEDFKYGGVNITAFRLVDPTRPDVQRVVSEWEKAAERRAGRPLDGFHLKTETALMFDAVHLFAKALHDLDQSQNIDIRPLSCDRENAWVHGNSLINYMKLVEVDGLSGLIKFDPHGFRTIFNLDVLELTESGLEKIGSWSYKDDILNSNGVNITKNYIPKAAEILPRPSQVRMIRVTTFLQEPYAQERQSTERLYGNDRYVGFGIDIVDYVCKQLGFNYTIYIYPPGAGGYGSRDPKTRKWRGMLTEILNNKTDAVIADLSITKEREEAVDFTMPFMNLGISILFTKPTKEPPSLLSFMAPFSMQVWIWITGAYLGVSLVLFVLARFSPYEWDNPYPCIEDPDNLENCFNFRNSLWFTMGALMQQGSDIAPKAGSTRMVAGIWWFFTLIMVSSYTANLAAFLTVDLSSSPIESVEDLPKQNKIKYGCMRGGSTCNFFRDSSIPIMQQLWRNMHGNPDYFSSSNDEGVKRVEGGTYAYFIESVSNEYITQRKCSLRQVGGLLDSKGYGIAVAKGSPLKSLFTAEILKMQENGEVASLKKKWWESKSSRCDDSSGGGGGASELGLANVGGVFVVLLSGLGISCLIGVVEFVWKSKTSNHHRPGERSNICIEIIKELRFAVMCRGSKKPVRKDSDASDDTSEQNGGLDLDGMNGGGGGGMPLTGYDGRPQPGKQGGGGPYY